MSENLLSLVIWVPIAAGLLTLATGGEKNAGLARMIALAGSLAGFLLSLPLYFNFQPLHGGMQFVELAPWIASLNINYALGVDGISVWFIILNSFTTLLVVLAGWQVIQTRVAQYFAAFLIMSGLINGAFAALDAVLEQALATRERNLLATLPLLLAKRFGHLYKAHQEALGDRLALDDPEMWMRPGGWLAMYCRDMQAVLLAELEVRLQPVAGLIEALGNEVTA